MLQGVMCRDTVSVGWDGALYSCDLYQHDRQYHHSNSACVQGVMCRDTVSVGWDGALYNCDLYQHDRKYHHSNSAFVQGVMCRDTVSVGWDGALYDCDFNQQLALGLGGVQVPKTVFDISSLAELQVTGDRFLGRLTPPPCQAEQPQDQ
jgi:Protein of unknown function (DUF3641)